MLQLINRTDLQMEIATFPPIRHQRVSARREGREPGALKVTLRVTIMPFIIVIRQKCLMTSQTDTCAVQPMGVERRAPNTSRCAAPPRRTIVSVAASMRTAAKAAVASTARMRERAPLRAS